MQYEWNDLSEETRTMAQHAHDAVLEGTDVVLIGPARSKKTMIARRLQRHVKQWDKCASDATLVHRLAGLALTLPTVDQPWRAPHHTCSVAGMAGSRGRPGEVSLAHGGILFLDETLEFPRQTLDAVRVAHREKVVTFSERQSRWVRALPADFVLVLSFNWCPCGKLGQQPETCECSTQLIDRHKERTEKTILMLSSHFVQIELT
jgi:magnesium chelatase family protein